MSQETGNRCSDSPDAKETAVFLESIKVDDVVGSARLSVANLQPWLLASLMLFIDSFDFAAATVGGPSIRKAFALRNEVMGLIFSAGFLGILIGGIAFAYAADRIGRRRVAISASLIFSTASLAAAFVKSPELMMACRLVTGFGVGGVTVTAIAYLTEWAPRKQRAAFVTTGLMAYGLGSTALALIGKQMIPHWGWPIVFIVPGVFGLVLSAILALWMRESLLFLANKNPESVKLRAYLSQLDPGVKIEPRTAILGRETAAVPKVGISQLFAGKMKFITPLLWLGYFLETLVYASLSSWLQIVLIDLGRPQSDAALALSYYGGLHVLMVLALAMILDKASYLAGVALAAIAAGAFAIIAMGLAKQPALLIAAMVVGATAGVTIHSVFNGTVGMFYPTSTRSRGIAFATSWGRIGQIAGPPLFGLLMGIVGIPHLMGLVVAMYALIAAISLLLFGFRKGNAHEFLR